MGKIDVILTKLQQHKNLLGKGRRQKITVEDKFGDVDEVGCCVPRALCCVMRAALVTLMHCVCHIASPFAVDSRLHVPRARRYSNGKWRGSDDEMTI